ncbi:ATPase, T2SS/T4P/T4SS family [Thermodesulfobacteriota bacterium]
MSSLPEYEKIDIDSKTKEAEAYHSHGLYKESLELYEQMLSSAPELDPERQKLFEEKVLLLQKEIEAFDKLDESLSAEEISLFQDTLEAEEDVHDILGSISAFKDLGLFQEAVDEYMKLFARDYPFVNIIPGMIECLFEIHSPSRVIDQVEKIISENNLSDDVTAEVKFTLGLEMEKHDHKDLALDFYESVREINPGYPEIESKLKSLLAAATYRSKYDYLLKNKIATKEQMEKALELSKKTNKSVEFVLVEHIKIKKEDLGKSLSLFFKCPFKAFDPQTPIPHELLTKVKKPFLLKNCWVPFSWEMATGQVEILIDNPADISRTDYISTLIKAKKYKMAVAIKEDILAFIKYFYEQKDTAMETSEEDSDDNMFMLPEIDFEEEDEQPIEEDDDLNEGSSQIVRMVDQILITAYRKDASDIHIEPSVITKKTDVRYRIDGVCQQVLQIPILSTRGLLSRLKIMANLDIAERRLPQDGKIKFKRKGIKPFELRLATLPTAGGYEDAVLRILAESGAMKFDDMGLSDRNLAESKKIIIQPYGLYLVVGPTGSGKTTTLHSALGYINKPGVKIWTAEDPVEISQQGLRQVECKPKIGLDFARVMRAFLRADPDIIMIGEMRDKETASIGIEASLTGHLVFSTLHTNSAPETITRLLDMGLNPLNFSDAFLGVLAQRLVRRLCKACKKEYHPSGEEFDTIRILFGKEAFDATDIKYTPEFKLYRAEGCEVCSGSSYKGRLGIHELMVGTPEIKKMIKTEAPTDKLFEQAAKDGMATLIQDGIQKVLLGLTDLDEIRRVCVS